MSKTCLTYNFSGLNHEQNMQKMRLLSFMQLAESTPEISFDVIEKELQIDPEEVESFIIEGKFVKIRSIWHVISW